MFLKNSAKLKGTNYIIAEDYSKPTLDLRRQLILHAKDAKTKNPNILGFRLNYKHLVIKYINNATKQAFYRGFNPDAVLKTPGWHKLSTNPRSSVGGNVNGYHGGNVNGYHGGNVNGYQG